MTEADWLACDDPRPMLQFLEGKVSDRKLRLFAYGCCREFWGSSTDKATQLALVSAKHLAEAGGIQTIKASIQVSAGQAVLDCSASEPLGPLAVSTANGLPKQVSTSAISLGLVRVLESLACSRPFSDQLSWQLTVLDHVGFSLPRQANLLRDIVRGAFRPLLFRAAWRTLNGGAAHHVAQVIYTEQAFEQLPILADALMDAGCDSDEILDHLHDPGPHLSGCWVLDLCLNRQ